MKQKERSGEHQRKASYFNFKGTIYKKVEDYRFILPALLAQGLCPGSAGRTEEKQVSQEQEDHTAPDPQRYLQRWCGLMLLQQFKDDLNSLGLELGHCDDFPALVGLFLVLYFEGATSSVTGNRLES